MADTTKIAETFRRAVGHHLAGQLAEAEQVYRQLLDAEPGLAAAWRGLGLVALQAGNCDVAADCLQQALRIQPEFPEAHDSLGLIRSQQRRFDEAIACFQEALRQRPGDVQILHSLAIAYQEQRRLVEATAYFQQALRIAPDFADAHYNLANAWRDQGYLGQAITHYERALRLKPDFVEALVNFGKVLHDVGEIDEATAALQHAIRLRPDHANAQNSLGNVFKAQARHDEAIACFRRALELKPSFVVAHSNLVYLLNFCPEYDAGAILAAHCAWNDRWAAALAGRRPAHADRRSAERRLRIGYVSPNFRDHVVGRNLLPLLREHDRRQFEIFCYSSTAETDAITARFESYADRWHEVARLSDDELADKIAADQVDILVDLSLHMAGNRLLVFARKAAPVQVTFAGYPGTTGVAAIDYRLTDVYLDPPGRHDDCYTETSIRLPETFWCYEPLADEPSVGPLPALGQGHVTFGCLNNFAKVNAGTLALWAQALQAVDNSQLVLLAAAGSHRQRTLDVLGAEGIAAERITFVPPQPREQYLRTYERIDIGLDTLPYSGHTTSLDSYWMGAPVVTLAGQTVVGRAGVSQLMNLGLPELIARSPQDFVRIAAELAGNSARLSTLRATLRERMKTSPLMDAGRFARNIEAAYRQMWARWCAAR